MESGQSTLVSHTFKKYIWEVLSAHYIEYKNSQLSLKDILVVISSGLLTKYEASIAKQFPPELLYKYENE